MAFGEESKLLGTRLLQNYVRGARGKWTPDDLRKLLEQVRGAGFGKVSEARIVRLLEDNRERWLVGENKAGPPPPGAAPAAASFAKATKPDTQSGAGGAGRKLPGTQSVGGSAGGKKKAGKERVAMPEQPKPVRPEVRKPVAPPARPAPTAAKPVASKPAVPTLSSKDASISDSAAQEKHTRRLALIKSSQDLGQESMETEVEIRKHEVQQAELKRNLDRLESQRSPLEEQRQTLQDEVDSTSKDIATHRAEIDKLTTRRASLEESVGGRKKERSEHVAAIARFKAEKERLIS